MIYQYLTFLRGINVSGQKKIKMADLRALLQKAGFADPKTYIQSGNVFYNHPERDKELLSQQISSSILDVYHFEVACLTLEYPDLCAILENNPHTSNPEKDIFRQYFTLLFERPAPDKIDSLNDFQDQNPPEEFQLKYPCIYFYSPLGYGRAKMNNNFFEKKLSVKATTRNWKTMYKLKELMEAND